MTGAPPQVHLEPVDATNWRPVARLEVEPEQERFVAATTYYLALCTYDGIWQPLAVKLDGAVVGFLMWGVDPADGSCWLGGIVIDRRHQGRGLGRATTREAVRMLHETHGHEHFALSYDPANERARRTYAALGFEETGEVDDDEVIARMELSTT